MAEPKFLIDVTTEEAQLRLGERTLELLKTTKLPKHAFVVYEIPKIRYSGKGADQEITTGFVVVNVEDQPSQEYNLNDLINRNGKYCCHANFPTHNDKDPLRVKKYNLYNDPNSGNPWDRLEVHCQAQLGHAQEISLVERKFKGELEAAKQEMESLKAELAKTKKKGAKQDEQVGPV